ncbi:hypothetical protein TOPH_04543 [Tolypocladium ophioglossoides CBS 100239]|uniref:Meiotically up-regulated protein n=1 Tax=Tolypocladium ophioglossoides (strain CBS 100239) TaxID=1163406 RepID=A0A0L0NA36_TOLOC|nr:hypothetical protein TOPH_04543 [Tolypocladium ophioglossoides CBS 100239]
MSVGSPRLTSLLPPSPSNCCCSQRALLPPSCIALPKPHPTIDDAAILGSGLRTPPIDNMSTTYHHAMPAYDGQLAMHSYPAGMAHASRSKAILDDSRSSQHYRYPSQQTQVAPVSQTRNNSFSLTTQLPHPTSRPSTRPSTPMSEAAMTAKQEPAPSRRNSDSLIYHSLQIPKCISPNGGNLSDFAAQMTCLFWFDSVENLKKAESIRSRPLNAPIIRLPNLAKPYDQFRKWVYNVLSTTQVTQNVIFLALLFIYRLKMSTPQIKGRAGSEYRLLTVALMLGNKFLDDNTYTNKTWAEVSCFAVQEIHVMEVEFLSNMRYNLLASKDEWEDWLVKLASFHEYYERALNLPASPIHIPSPTNNAFNSPIPSPTGLTLSGIPDMPPYTPLGVTSFSPSSQSKNFSAYQANTTSPLASKLAMNLPVTRKRSPEEELADHPAKRQVPLRAGHMMHVPPMNTRANGPVEAARLPVPQLTVVTSTTPNPASAYSTANGYSHQMAATTQHLVSLPPLQPGVRAMSTVYQPGPATMVQQPAVPAITAVSVPTPSYPIAPLASHSAIHYGTPTKHHSPGSLAPFGSSPLVEHLGSGSAVHTPISHTPISNSPSVYLQQRASPYKPVRHVNKLLYPPPSASLNQYHLGLPVPQNQMHYQPLGRRHDVRTGVVPEFLVYNRGQHHHFSSHGGQQGHYPS